MAKDLSDSYYSDKRKIAEDKNEDSLIQNSVTDSLLTKCVGLGTAEANSGVGSTVTAAAAAARTIGIAIIPVLATNLVEEIKNTVGNDINNSKED